MYAIVRTGGKQYRVEEGRSLQVDRLSAEEGSKLELNDVLLIADDGEVTVGEPTIEGARVLAEVEEQGRHAKIIVFKYKSKVRTRKKTGHRQHYTRLTIQEILRPGQKPKQAAKPKRARRKKADEAPAAEADEAAAAEATAEAAAEAPAVEAPAAEAATETAKPKRGAGRKPAAKETPAAEAEAPTSEDAPTTEAPKRRTRRKAAEKDAPAAEKAEEAPAEEADEKPKATRRRTTRPKTEDKEKD